MAASLVLLLAACGDDDGTGPGSNVASVTVTAASQTIDALGATLQVQATALDAAGNPVAGVTFTFTSSAPAVASVDANGVVTALSNGTASITATAGGSSGSISITVEQVATNIAFATPPTNNSVDEPFAGLSVEMRDANGNVTTNFEDAVTISIGTNPQGGSLTGQFTVDAVAGVASFPNLALDAAGAGYTLEATADGLSVESDPFNVTLPSIYVGNASGSTLTVIDPATNTVIGTVTSGSSPTGVEITPDGLFAYVSNRNAGTVSVIETPGNTVVQTITVGSNPNVLRMSPDGSLVYVPNSNSDNVSVIDTETNTVTATIAVGDFPVGAGFTPDGEFVYVANRQGGTVSVIETASNTVTATITVGAGPVDALVTQDGSNVYVPNDGSANVSVIATSSNTVIATIPVGTTPGLPAFTPDGSALFVPNFNSNNVSRIETATNTVSATIPAGIGAFAAAVSLDGEFVYVSNFSAGSITVIEVATNTVVETIAVGGSPFELEFMPAPIP